MELELAVNSTMVLLENIVYFIMNGSFLNLIEVKGIFTFARLSMDERRCQLNNESL